MAGWKAMATLPEVPIAQAMGPSQRRHLQQQQPLCQVFGRRQTRRRQQTHGVGAHRSLRCCSCSSRATCAAAAAAAHFARLGAQQRASQGYKVHNHQRRSASLAASNGDGSSGPGGSNGSVLPVPDPSAPGPREDDVLPDSLASAISDAAAATADAIASGTNRAQVEISLPEFWDPISGPIFPNQGDQERFWRMNRRFIEKLQERSGSSCVRVIFPDIGVAAMLSHRWKGEMAFGVGSLDDRSPVAGEDDLVVFACPDPPGAEDCLRIIRRMAERDDEEGRLPRPVVLFNQRLSGGEVGLGLNARRLRQTFLQTFTVTYSLRPVGDIGSVFRRYPALWKVFVEEEELAGRYRLIAELPYKPAGEALDTMIRKALRLPGPEEDAAGGGKGAAVFESVRSVVSSFQSFMRSLSN